MDYSVYVHIPFCKSRCIYCDFVSSVLPHIPYDAYTEQVLAEYRWRKQFLPYDATLKSVYLGGGTPSLFPADKLAQWLFSFSCDASSGIEVTVEMNPGDVDAQWVDEMMLAGVTRFSVGVQSMDNDRLHWLQRRHTVEEAIAAVKLLQERGAQNITVDFIYGTPEQGLSDIRKELVSLCDLGVPHISAYELTVADNTILSSLPHIKTLNEDEKMAQWHCVNETLSRCGFELYEVSNYAQRGFRSVHNCHYWTGGQYLGLGSGAHGFLQVMGRRIRYSNGSDLSMYLNTQLDAAHGKKQMYIANGFDEEISNIDYARELMMLGLRWVDGVDALQLDELVQTDSRFKKSIRTLLNEKLLFKKEGRYLPCTQAILLADSLAVQFF